MHVPPSMSFQFDSLLAQISATSLVVLIDKRNYLFLVDFWHRFLFPIRQNSMPYTYCSMKSSRMRLRYTCVQVVIIMKLCRCNYLFAMGIFISKKSILHNTWTIIITRLRFRIKFDFFKYTVTQKLCLIWMFFHILH